MEQRTERHTFKISQKQKQTLLTLRRKYKYNTSQFIREAIDEKLQRERDDIFKQYKEIQEYLNRDCHF
jgi:hypothetical protein